MAISDYEVYKPRNAKKRTIAILLSLSVVVLVFFGWLGVKTGSGANAESGDNTMMSLAESVPIEPTWEQAGPKIEKPGGWWCSIQLSTVCGTVRHSYVTDRPLTEADLIGIGKQAGWDLTLSENCTTSSQDPLPYLKNCSGSTTVGDFEVTIEVREGTTETSDLEILVTDLKH